MKFRLIDWAGRNTEVDVGNFEEIAAMRIMVISGDEVLLVIYKDYTTERFDSSSDRIGHCLDNEYEIYNIESGLNLLENEDFMNRTDSYYW